MNRREFLKASVAGFFSTGVVEHLYGISSAEQDVPIPRRKLGKTGEMVSIIGFGGGSRFCRIKDEDDAIGLVNLAIDMGINYFDTAPAYGNGMSERRYGQVMKHRKKEVFLAAKTDVRSRDGALAQIEGSLKRLQTDVIDLIQIHCLSRKEEIQQIGEPHGALAAIRKLQEEGVIRFVGVTGHPDAEVIKEAMRVHDFDTVMVPLNATREGGYEKTVLPRAVESEIGIIAMKVLGQGAFIGRGENKASAVELIRYSLSLPVTLTVIGMDSPDILARDISLAKSLEPMNEREMNLLSACMSGAGGTGYWNKLPSTE